MMAAALAGCLIAGGALAQPGPQQGRGPGMMQGSGPGYGYGMMQQGYGGWGMMQGYGGGYGMMPGWDMMEAHTAGTIAFLKAEIGVTPAQEPVWEKFATALQAMIGAGHGRRGAMMTDRSKAEALPETLADRVAWMESHLAALKQVQAAAGPFYAALDATQKQKADALLGCGPCGR
jgi:hypothetical protein